VEAAEAEARRDAAELRQVRRRVVLAIERAWVELRAASEQLEAIGPQLGSEAEAALLAARTAYGEGEITLVAWLDAVRAYYEAESTYAALLADHFIRRAELEQAVGGSLFGGR
jgi:outer membrane protein TolC